MRNRDKRTALSAVFAFVVIATVLWWGVITLPSSRSTKPAASLALLSTEVRRVILPRDYYAIIDQRPLFTSTRRPILPPTHTAKAIVVLPPAVPPPMIPADKLMAVAIGPDRKAAVLQLMNGKTSVVLETEWIFGWQVARVASDHVVLKNGKQEVVLSFPLGAQAHQTRHWPALSTRPMSPWSHK